MQQTINSQFMTRRGIQVSAKLNKQAAPLSIRNKNDSMKMKSKAFTVKRRTSAEPTNMSSKAVSKMTSGRPGAARSMSSKKFMAKRVTQVAPKQQSMSSSNPLKKTVSTQPKAMSSIKKSIRKTMGY
jgi:hypothetical protein